MRKFSAAAGLLIYCLVIGGCDKSAEPEKVVEDAKPAPGQTVGKVLPFQVCDLEKNAAFKDGLSMVRADIKVSVGGRSADWVATAVAVAKQLGALNASTDVQVYAYRSDLDEFDTKAIQNGYKWLARVDYAVKPQHALGTNGGSTQWLINYATDTSVVTPEQILIERDYQALMDKFGQPAIDDKVVAVIKKKYNIKGEFNLPRMNLDKNTSNPNEFFVERAGQEPKLKSLGDILAKGGRNIECST